jgi:DNA-binding transcriptional regulator YbjK
MMWILLGIGSALHAGNPEVLRKDSASLTELRSRLPSDLKAKVELAHTELIARRDTLAHLSSQEKNQWLDSLRREAQTRRTHALENLTPEERERVEARLRQLEHNHQTRPTKSSNPGFRQ